MVTNHDTVYNEFILFVGDGMADGADQSANGREFSTLDYDHDILSNEPCADLYQGAQRRTPKHWIKGFISVQSHRKISVNQDYLSSFFCTLVKKSITSFST